MTIWETPADIVRCGPRRARKFACNMTGRGAAQTSIQLASRRGTAMSILSWLRNRGLHWGGVDPGNATRKTEKGGRAGMVGKAGKADKKELAALAERVTRLCPYVRLVPDYRKRLAPALAIADRYLRDVVAGLRASAVASEVTWGTDPCIRAFFGRAQDVMPVLSRSADLRDFFSRSPSVVEAYAVLGMAKQERHTLGVALEGEVMRSEVPQTTVSFVDHRVRICAVSEAALREEIASRMLDQLVLQALAQVAGGKPGSNDVEGEQALVSTRLQLLEKQDVGMRGALGGDAVAVADASVGADTGKAARLHEQVDQNGKAIASLGAPAGRAGVPERQLRALVDVLSHADASFLVERERVRLSRMNVVLAPDSDAVGDDLELMTARIPGDPPLVRTFALICVTREKMLSPMQLLDDAARML